MFAQFRPGNASSSITTAIDYKFRHNIVKVAMDPRGDSNCPIVRFLSFTHLINIKSVRARISALSYRKILFYVI